MNGKKEIDDERVHSRRGPTKSCATPQGVEWSLLREHIPVCIRVQKKNCTPAARKPFSLPSSKRCSSLLFLPTTTSFRIHDNAKVFGVESWRRYTLYTLYYIFVTHIIHDNFIFQYKRWKFFNELEISFQKRNFNPRLIE